MRDLCALSVTVIFAACASTTTCPPARVCGGATWLAVASTPQSDGRMVLAPAIAATSSQPPGSDELPVGTRPVFLKFDLSALGTDGVVDRAVLALNPHPSWRPNGRPVRIFARAITSPWSTNGVGAGRPASLAPDPATEAVLPSQSRVPVRLDVTVALRNAQNGRAAMEGIALSTDGGNVVFTSIGTSIVIDRPRLEVVLR